MPTSRATRVTSEVKALICSIIVLTIVAERRNSPLSGRPSTSRLIVCCRSPLATAAIVRVTSVVGHSRSSISVLTECSIAPQAPERRSLDMRWRVLPSLPTIWPDPLELARQALVGADDLVEGIGDLAGKSGLVTRQTHREIAIAHRSAAPAAACSGPRWSHRQGGRWTCDGCGWARQFARVGSWTARERGGRQALNKAAGMRVVGSRSACDRSLEYLGTCPQPETRRLPQGPVAIMRLRRRRQAILPATNAYAYVVTRPAAADYNSGRICLTGGSGCRQRGHRRDSRDVIVRLATI